MRLTPDHPLFNKVLVFLNNRHIKAICAADDEEGWVEVPDLKAMSPPPSVDTQEPVDTTTEPQQWEEIPVIRKTGKVQFMIWQPKKQ